MTGWVTDMKKLVIVAGIVLLLFQPKQINGMTVSADHDSYTVIVDSGYIDIAGYMKPGTNVTITYDFMGNIVNVKRR